MEEEHISAGKIDFVVGSEIQLKDILKTSGINLLLNSIISSGIVSAFITDEKYVILWAEGDSKKIDEIKSSFFPLFDKEGVPKAGALSPLTGEGEPACPAGRGELIRKTFYHEGEPIGHLFISSSGNMEHKFLSSLADIAQTAVDMLIKSGVKRMLTTELHTTIVHQSYEELLDKNRRLSASEKKYIELVETLEQKVEERTSELRKAHSTLLQQEKMASIGQLAAGIAHEINNPIGFIYSNLNTLGKYMLKIKEMLGAYKADSIANDRKTDELYRRLKMDFIMEDIPELVRQSMEGAERVRKIVADLKGFSHIDDSEEMAVDINKEIEKTINILAYESRDKAVFIKEYGEIPLFLCNPGLICQVFLNIILNALQACEGMVEIRIKTHYDGREISVSIADNGPGIPDDIIKRVFEPFFTTKEVGKGTGLGLTIVYDIIKSHGGDITIKSEKGKGTEFMILLPVKEQGNV
jgi:two-component system, NtrC family, sensor kinase